MEDNVAWKRVLLMGEADDDGGCAEYADDIPLYEFFAYLLGYL